MPTHARTVLSMLLFVASTTSISTQQRSPGPVLAEPGISPDGREVAFVSGGDIWTAPVGGAAPAVARLLVSHPATESRPLYSPSGDAIAFVSTRSGNGDIYALSLATGVLTRLTFDDGPEMLDGWSRDGKSVFFFTNTRDISGMNDVFRVTATGGTPMPATNERYTNEFFSASAPDGRSIAFSARGTASGQWWRNGHSHLDQSEIWLAADGAPAASRYKRVVERGAKALWPMWSADGKGLFYMSDRGGAENIWQVALDGAARPITKFTKGRVLWPSISTDGRTITFERDFSLWTLDTASGRAAELQVELRGAPATPAIEHQRFTNQFSDLALAPDGKKVAFVVRGEVFAGASRDGNDAERITTTPGREYGVAWAPDSRRLFYTSSRETQQQQLVLYDLTSRRETVLLTTAEELSAPVVAPDGLSVAFVEGRRSLKVLALDAAQPRVVVQGLLPVSRMAWSPDSKWIAYVSIGARGFANVNAVAVAGSPKPAAGQAISMLANFNTYALAWSPDGTFVTFATGQRTERHNVARVDLVLRTPKFREDRFRSLFEPESPRPVAPAPVAPVAPSAPSAPSAPVAPVTPAIVFEDIRRRLSLLPIGLDVQDQVISPDGKLLLVTAAVAGQTNLYTYSIDELSREPAVARQLTSTPGNKTNAQFSPDSKEVYFLEAGRPQAITVEERRVRSLDLTAEMDVDFTRERPVVFQQAWRMLSDNFFDAKHNGVDWAAARTAYGTRVEQARTPDEMRRVTQLMIGELNASHLGFSAPAGSATPPFTGRLGVRFDADEYAKTGRLRISEILPLGPVAITGSVKTGDVITSVNGRAITAATNIDELLQHTIGKRVVLGVAADGGGSRDVAVQPVNLNTEKGLLYRSWVESNRAMIGRLSNGRLGYAHMIDMSETSLEQLFTDLDADNHGKDGVVIDVRNNNGGFVNVYAIDVLARRSYFNMTRRGYTAVPSRLSLGQRALERPTILLTNQHSLSDAEDFTEGYRSLKLGTVVGEPTAGWIIYTGNIPMMDGSILRVPSTRITANDGTDMEMHPRPVDVPVTRALGEAAQGRDTQIETAVRELLAQLDRRGTQQR